MTHAQAHDPRSIANLLLDEADADGVAITNIALQKLLYFAHGIHLSETKTPLVSGYFEAWQYGPVHPAVYSAFRSAGRNPIRFRAEARDILTGATRPIAPPSDRAAIRVIRSVVSGYGRMSAGRLVDISHAPKGPWASVVDKGRTSLAFGLRIPDDVIWERFKYHKVFVRDEPMSGDPVEDTPLA